MTEPLGIGRTFAEQEQDAKPTEVRRLISKADSIGGDLNHTYDRIMSLRLRLQGPTPQPETAPTDNVKEAPSSELGELDDMLSRLQRRATDISDVLNDLESI